MREGGRVIKIFPQRSQYAQMEHHPISLRVKDGRIIYARLYEGRDEYGLVGETEHVYDTNETWVR